MKVPRDLDGQAPDRHRQADAGLQALPDACSTRGSRRSRCATGRPEPGDDILLSVITDGRHAAIDMRLVDARQRQRAGQQAQQADRQRPPHLAGDGGAQLRARRTARPIELPGAGADDLLRSRHDQRRGDARLLGLSLDQRRADPPRRAGLRDRLHAGLQEVRRTSSGCSTTSTPARSAS